MPHSKRPHVNAVHCAHCGNPIIDDGRSPTGFLHAVTNRSRCDGERLPYRHAMRYPLATFA